MCTNPCPHVSAPQGLSRLMRHTESDAWLALGLMHHLSVLPLYKALSCLSGSLWAKALQVRELTWGSATPALPAVLPLESRTLLVWPSSL